MLKSPRTSRSRFSFGVVMVVLALLAVLATPAAADIDFDDPANTVQPLAAADALWADPEIPVCWEVSANTFLTARGWVQDAVERSWEAVSNVDFVNWDSCTSGKPGVHIGVADAVVEVDGIGSGIDGKTNGVSLNFQFQQSNTNCSRDLTAMEYCVRVDAVHEFGHVLGFTHEHVRNDRPEDDCERARSGGSVAVWHLTEYEEDSVMNYCNGQWDTDAAGNYINARDQLSPLDVAGVQLAYGPWDGIDVPIRVHGKIYGEDHELFGPPETDELPIDDTFLLGDDSKTFSLCVGDEVVVDLEAEAIHGDTGAAIIVGSQLEMFEYFGCQRNDFEAGTKKIFELGATHRYVYQSVVSNELFGGDKASASVTFERVFDPADALSNCDGCENAAANSNFATIPPAPTGPTLVSAGPVTTCRVVTCNDDAPSAPCRPGTCEAKPDGRIDRPTVRPDARPAPIGPRPAPARPRFRR